MSAPLEPPDGRILSGVSVREGPEGISSFLEVSGQDSVAIVGVFSGFANRESLSRPLAESVEMSAAAGHSITMVSWRMMAADDSASFVGTFDPGIPGGTLASLARGDLDARLIEAATQIDQHDRPVMLRPNWEMNAPWFPWGAFERDGTPREGNTPADFRDAWVRARIVLDGGSVTTVDARLQEAGLPPLSASPSSGEVASPDDLAWVWSPNEGPARPEGAGHVTADYYPGDAYVDWVGLDWYQTGDADVAFQTSGRSSETDPLAPIDAFYAEYAGARDKPIVLAEWGVTAEPEGSGDDPDWMSEALAWVVHRPDVKALVYFNRDASDADHRLEVLPGSAAEYREAVADASWIGGRTDERSASGGSGDPTMVIALTIVAVLAAITVAGIVAGRVRRNRSRI